MIPMIPTICIVTIVVGTILPLVVLAAPTLVLSEVGIEDQAGESTADFIELYNPDTAALSLDQVNILRRTKTGKTDTSLRSSFSLSDSVPPGSYYLLVNPKAPDYLLSCADNNFVSGGTLTPDNSLALTLDDGTVLDTITYGSGHIAPFCPTLAENPPRGKSLVRMPDGTITPDALPTPTNSRGLVCAPSELPAAPPDSPHSIIISEVLPDTDAKNDAGEFIELYNSGASAVPLTGWLLRDSSATGKYEFPDASSLAPQAYICLTRGSDFTFALNNGAETLSLFDSRGTLITSLSYTNARENISLVSTPHGLRATKKPTPCAPNTVNQLPETKEKIPKHIYQAVPAEFRASGKDPDREALKYTWDFGDGHKSYKKNPAHTYKKKGAFTITLTTDDGVERLAETFRVKVESFPRRKMRIVRFFPNPAGRDTDHEWIEIENNEKQSVNLRGYSLATGSKRTRVANHPIREALVIPAQSRVRLTHTASAFSLPNKEGIIELRTPDGKVLHKVTYKEEKIPDDALFERQAGNRWVPVLSKVAHAAPAPQNASLAREEPADTPVTNSLPASKEAESHNERVLAYRRLLALGTDLDLQDVPITPHPPAAHFEPSSRTPAVHYATAFLHLTRQKANRFLGTLWP